MFSTYNLFPTFRFNFEIFQTEEPAETTDRKTPKLYPDLFKCDLENVEDVLKGTFYEQLLSHQMR